MYSRWLSHAVADSAMPTWSGVCTFVAERGSGEFLGSQWGFDIYEAGFCDDFGQADEVDQEQAELYCNAQQGNAQRVHPSAGVDE